MAIAFDTLEYARRLKQAGFSDAQAEGQTQALVAAMSEGLATRQDVAAVSHEVAQLRQEVGDLGQQLRQEVGDLGQQLHQEIGALGQQLRQEIGALDRQMHLDMGSLEARLTSSWRQDLAVAETRMTLRLGGIMVAGIAVVSALVKAL
jgi:hypothetical protein